MICKKSKALRAYPGNKLIKKRKVNIIEFKYIIIIIIYK